MALDWVQVDKRLVEGPVPSEAGTTLKLTEDAVIGKLVRAWAWSLEHARPDGLVRGVGAVRAIERAAHWGGKEGSFVRAFPTVFSAMPEGVLFLGWLERYGSYLEQLERDAKRKRGARTSGKTSGGHPGGHPDGYPPDKPPETGGERPDSPAECFSILKEEDVSSFTKRSTPLPIERVGEKFGPQLAVPVPALPDDKAASGAAYFAWVQNERLGAGFAVEKPPPIAALGRWFSEIMGELGGDVDRLDATLAAFVHDPYWRPKNAPFRAFMSEWRSFVPRKAAAR